MASTVKSGMSWSSQKLSGAGIWAVSAYLLSGVSAASDARLCKAAVPEGTGSLGRKAPALRMEIAAGELAECASGELLPCKGCSETQEMRMS